MLWGAQLVQSEIVMFTAVFVLLTLLVQAPLLPYVLRWTGCVSHPAPIEP